MSQSKTETETKAKPELKYEAAMLRTYCPEIGRFLSRDRLGEYIMRQNAAKGNAAGELANSPLGAAAELVRLRGLLPMSDNLYIYCNNDPVNSVDPDGMKPITFNCGSDQITLDFNDCSATNIAAFQRAWCAAHKATLKAVAELNVYVKVASSINAWNKENRPKNAAPVSTTDDYLTYEHVFSALQYGFGYDETFYDPQKKRFDTKLVSAFSDMNSDASIKAASTVLDKYTKVLALLRTGQKGDVTYKVTCDCASAGSTHALTPPGGSDTTFYGLFFAAVGRRPGVIVHELSHAMAGTDDYFYIQNIQKDTTAPTYLKSYNKWGFEKGTEKDIQVSGILFGGDSVTQTVPTYNTDEFLNNAANLEFYLNKNYLGYTYDAEANQDGKVSNWPFPPDTTFPWK